MTHSPIASTGYNTSTISSYSAAKTTQETADDGQLLTVSTTAYRYTETRYTPGDNRPPVTYQPPDTNQRAGARPTAGESRAEQTPAADEVSPGSNRNSASTAIRAFIEQRLAADLEQGASPEQMQSRLQAGFDGFIQGYTEALEQIKAMGLFEGDVKTAVEDTYKQMMAGFDELAEKYGLESPVPEDTQAPAPVAAGEGRQAPVTPMVLSQPRDAFQGFLDKIFEKLEASELQTLIQPSSDFYRMRDEEASESRLFRFNLRTTDGDVVTIESYSDRGYRLQGDGDGLRLDVAGMESLSFSVRGELDADELSAISDVLAQVNELAETFFSGDVEQAFNRAQEIGFDTDEIARFSLNLTQVQYKRIEDTYGAVAESNVDRLHLQDSAQIMQIDNKIEKLSVFVRQLENLQEQGTQLGLGKDQLLELTRFGAQPRFANHPAFEQFTPFVEKLMEALPKAEA